MIASIDFDVDDAATARALGSGDLDVLGTPKVVALMEEAAVAAIRTELVAGETTVGVKVSVDHVAAVRVGDRVTATATVTKLESRRIHFDVTVEGADTTVATGTHVRVLVDRGRFLDRLP